jgi:hypothetical protein
MGAAPETSVSKESLGVIRDGFPPIVVRKDKGCVGIEMEFKSVDVLSPHAYCLLRDNT